MITAAEKGYADLVSLLLERKAEVNAADHVKQTALQFAAAAGHFDVVKALMESGAKAEVGGGFTAMERAAEKGHARSVESFLAKPGKLGNIGIMLWRASENGHLEVVRLLASKDEVRPMRDSALLDAVKGGHLSVVEALLEAGADVHYKNGDGDNSVLLAAAKDHDAVLEVPLKAGGRVTRGKTGGTAVSR